MRPGSPHASLTARLLAGSLALTAIAACAGYPGSSAPTGSASLTVRPTFAGYRVANVDVDAYGTDAVKKLTLALSTVVADDPATTGINEFAETPVVDGQNQPVAIVRTSGFGAPVTFDHLAYGHTYRIRATATRPDAGGTGDEVLSAADAFVDVTVEPTVESQRHALALQVQLKSRQLSAKLLGDALDLTEPTTLGDREAPAIAVNSATGEYLVAWEANSSSEVMAQRVNADGTRQGVPFTVSDADIAQEKEPSVAFDPLSGNFVVAYIENRGIIRQVRSRLVRGAAVAGQPDTLAPSNLIVSQGGVGNFRTPRVSVRSNAGTPFVYTWQQYDTNTSRNLLPVMLGTAAGAAAPAPLAAVPTSLADATQPVLAVDGATDRMLVAYSDMAASFHALTVSALSLSSSASVSQVLDASSFAAGNPAIALNPTTHVALVAWQDGGRALAQPVRDDLTSLTPGASVTLSDGGFAFAPVAVYNARSNEFLVVWVDSDHYRLVARRLTGRGELIGTPFELSESADNNGLVAVAYNVLANEAFTVFRQPYAPTSMLGQRLDFFALP